MKSLNLAILALGMALALAACAGQPVYTQPYAAAPPAAFAVPIPVTLTVSYTTDGKPDPKRAQELEAALTAVLEGGGGFKPVAGQGERLEIGVEDNSTAKRSLLAGFTATMGHLILGGAE
ncbi:MAG TPA: hypothetical protein VLG68_10215, partial [Gammaproteobacteria bacterium]|nr:hypothetical protein [Gammaproteobacteria bacterium]